LLEESPPHIRPKERPMSGDGEKLDPGNVSTANSEEDQRITKRNGRKRPHCYAGNTGVTALLRIIGGGPNDRATKPRSGRKREYHQVKKKHRGRGQIRGGGDRFLLEKVLPQSLQRSEQRKNLVLTEKSESQCFALKKKKRRAGESQRGA